MVGRIIRLIIGLACLGGAPFLFIKADLPWFGIAAILVGLVCLIVAIFPKKEEEKKQKPNREK